MSIPVFDAHCDTIFEAKDKGLRLRENSLHIDLKRGESYKPYAQVFAIFTRPENALVAKMDYKKDWPEDVLTKLSGELLDFLLAELGENQDLITLCRSAREVRAANAAGKSAAMISVEGAELLGCDLNRLKAAYAKGVRLINLCWNYDNALCGAANGVTKGGLTEKGADYVRAMQEIGIAVDLSHASERTFWDVVEMTGRPVIAGHSNAKALCANPRNLTDEQFKALVRLKGVAGLNLYPVFLSDSGQATIETIIAHAEHFLALGGEKSLCLGGDLDGVEYLPQGFTGLESYSVLYEALLKRNYPESLVRDIFYNNLLDVLEAVL